MLFAFFEQYFSSSVGTAVRGARGLGWKFMSLNHRQELCQLADLASDWLFTLVQPISNPLAC